jgi:hypothetical protein
VFECKSVYGLTIKSAFIQLISFITNPYLVILYLIIINLNNFIFISIKNLDKFSDIIIYDK